MKCSFAQVNLSRPLNDDSATGFYMSWQFHESNASNTDRSCRTCTPAPACWGRSSRTPPCVRAGGTWRRARRARIRARCKSPPGRLQCRRRSWQASGLLRLDAWRHWGVNGRNGAWDQKLYFSTSEPYGPLVDYNSAVFEWVTKLGQRYARIHRSRHPITAAWKHIGCIQ